MGMEETIKAALGIALIMGAADWKLGLLFTMPLFGIGLLSSTVDFCMVFRERIPPIGCFGLLGLSAPYLQEIAGNELLQMGLLFVFFIIVAVLTAYGFKNL